MNAQHTPGPWYVVDLKHRPWTDALTIGTDPEAMHAVAHTTRGFEGDGTECSSHAWANARLIAAAPDLLELVALLTHYNDKIRDGKAPTQGQWEMFIDGARRVISKATGATNE